MLIDALTLKTQLQLLYGAHPSIFQSVGLVILAVFLYGAVIEIAARVAR